MLGWILVLAGPVLAVVLSLGSSTVTPATVDAGNRADRGIGPSGWAEMYTRAWLSADRDDSTAVAGFYPEGMRSPRSPLSQLPVDTTTLSATETGPGAWSVVVAAQVLRLQPNGTRPVLWHCVQVSLIHASATTPPSAAPGSASPPTPSGYVAAALPSLVTCPSTLSPATLDYSASVPTTGALGQSVLGFLTSYLTGGGDLPRYLSPGSGLNAVTSSAITAVRLEQLRTHDRFDAGEDSRPADGAQTRVLARAHALDTVGQATPMDYALTLTARAGRWEVTRIDPTPMTTGTPSAAASSTAPSSGPPATR